MDKIFELIAQTETREGKKPEARLGIRIKLSSFEATCFVTQPAHSFRALESEVQAIRRNLEEVLKEAREIFEGSLKKDPLGLRPDMTPGQVWNILSAVPEENDFIRAFNALGEGRRKEVAEHVLTHCNVFSGKAAVFSSRYDDKSALLTE